MLCFTVLFSKPYALKHSDYLGVIHSTHSTGEAKVAVIGPVVFHQSSRNESSGSVWAKNTQTHPQFPIGFAVCWRTFTSQSFTASREELSLPAGLFCPAAISHGAYHILKE